MRWPVVRLGDVATTSSGSTPPRGRLDYFDGAVPWAKIQDLTRSGMWLRDTDEHVTSSAIRDGRLPVFEPGTVLLAMYGSIGTASIASVPTTANQAILGLSPRGQLDSEYLWCFLKHHSHQLARLGRGGTQANINASIVRDTRLPLPPVDEQRRIAARLTAQIAAIDQLRRDVRRRREASDALVIQLVRSTISRNQESTTAKLSGVAEMRRSPSVTSDGDVIVRTVTSGCLTPTGFSTAGFSTGRMTADAAVLGVVNAGEVLVARSNTEELVGRAALYPGGSEGVVASDLIFRIAPDPARLMPEFLAHHLAGLQLSGYWRNRSSGASSTMKKITKTLLWDLDIPIPPLEEQLKITEELQVRLASIDSMESAIRAEQEAIDALPAALLRRTFDGHAA